MQLTIGITKGKEVPYKQQEFANRSQVDEDERFLKESLNSDDNNPTTNMAEDLTTT